MSVLGKRAVVARALFDVMRTHPDFRAWLDETAVEAVDADGDLVSISVSDDEKARTLVDETVGHAQDVIICTLHRGRVVAWVLGPSLSDQVSPLAHDVPIDEEMTVGDVVDEMLRLPEGADYVLEFAGQRHRATLAPVAA